VVEESARKRLLELCLNDRGDVADLKRVVPRRLTDPVSVAVETGVVGAHDELIVFCEDGNEICFDRAGNGPVQKLDGKKLPKESDKTAETVVQKEATVPKRKVNLEAVKLVREAAGLIQKGEERQAQLVLERTLIVMEKGPDDLLAVRVNNMLGLLLYKNGVYVQAANYFAAAADARAALEECEESLPFGILFGNLALALSNGGRKQKAKEILADGMTAILLNRKTETDDGLKHFLNTYLGIDPNMAKRLIEFSISLREPR
jgi:tetratricopeptide (TPR) repeat protein